MPKIIDLSQPIDSNMPVFPGDSQAVLKQTKFLEQDYHNNHRLEIGMHTGTHMDAPMHMLPSTKCISQYPLESFMGDGCLLDVRGQEIIEFREEYTSLREESIVLLCTGFSEFYGTEKYYNQHPVLTSEFCEFLISKRAKLIGMDMPSPDKFPFDVHKRLLGEGVFILENLTNLEQLVGVDSFEVIALPLKLNADGSMVRAVAKV